MVAYKICRYQIYKITSNKSSKFNSEDWSFQIFKFWNINFWIFEFLKLPRVKNRVEFLGT